tara:strand:+ start:16 stop:618 length:603 start_codon:yes stop_codon:yes gene_type:complete
MVKVKSSSYNKGKAKKIIKKKKTKTKRKRKTFKVVDNLNLKIQRVESEQTTKDTEVYFADIKNVYLKYIQQSTYIAGCQAWLRDKDILKSLYEKKGVSIVVNNERIPKETKGIYDCLKSFCTKKAIHYIGNKRKRFSAILHHKFLIGLDEDKKCQYVITGSYNLSENACNNLENIVVLKNPKVMELFCKEFKSIVDALED